MTIEEKVYEALTNPLSDVPNLTGNRILPDGVFQGMERPYIKHFVVSLDPVHTHAGMATLKRWPYQISMFADSISSLTAVRAAVMAALDQSTDPKFYITGLVSLDGVDSTDTPVVGQALLLDAWWYEE
jgi:hypothetical protein